MGFDPIYMGMTVVFMLLSKWVGSRLQSKFKEYSAMPIPFSGKEIAEKMLQDGGVTDVQIVSVPGSLTDHYHPTKKTVNLSESVYNQRNVAAAAVAAHEVGHAIQHATAYKWLGMRSKLVPVVNFSSNWIRWVLMIGIGLALSGNPYLLLAGVIMFAFTTLFAFITLPVEFDASRRALNWLTNTGTLKGQNHVAATDALKWAARTYVVAAVASLGQLLYFARYLLAGRD